MVRGHEYWPFHVAMNMKNEEVAVRRCNKTNKNICTYRESVYILRCINIELFFR